MRELAEWEVGQPATVTVLGGRPEQLCGQVDGLAGLTLRVVVDSVVAVGATVKVEWGDTLLLGEAVRCQPASGRYSVLLHLEQSLLHTAELARLAKRLLEEGAGAPAEQRVAVLKPVSRLNRARTP